MLFLPQLPDATTGFPVSPIRIKHLSSYLLQGFGDLTDAEFSYPFK